MFYSTQQHKETTMTATAPQTNTSGFVNFTNRSQSYRGDRYTWARYNAETRQLTVNLARSGRISQAYQDEFAGFCATYGIDFARLRHGEPVTITLPEPAERVETIERETVDAADPRMDVYSRRITRTERAAFSDRADSEARSAHEMAMRRALDLQHSGDMVGSEAAVLESALIVRRWTLANNPEALA